MEYNYELLRKCHGLRFRATICNKSQEGVIKVMSEGVMLCYGEEGPGYLVTFGRRDSLSFSEQTFSVLPSDFEIVPRDPEKYTDWQVGDKLEGPNNEECSVIFRSGKLVIIEAEGEASYPFTCQGLFNKNNRLVLTDIEKKIIKEKEKTGWEPQDGDICFASTGSQRFIIIYGDSSYSLSNFVGKWELEKGHLWGYSSIRPATDEEKQRLFDALAKEGKRWNAEKKVVEDIEPEDDKPADVQKMISDALKGYIPKGDIEGFPVEVIAKMLERQYEQCKVVDVSVFEKDKIAGADDSGFDWSDTDEGYNFWDSVIRERVFSEFFKMYPKAEAPGAGMPSLKRFDPVLIRMSDKCKWFPAVFSRYGEDGGDYPFYIITVIGDDGYNQCIPLNEDTEKLIDTTEKYEE